MKRIRRSGAARLASWALTFVICSSTLCHFGAPHVYSQTAAASSVQTVAVIDFENKGGPANSPLVRLATDAVAVELANSARYMMLTRQEVDRQVKELGLRPPFDRVALTRLAKALDAGVYMDGEISFINVDEKRSPKAVNVGLKIRIHDASSGELITGAAQVGTAIGRPGQSDTDSLIQEATSNAALLGARSILSSSLPEGIVLSTVGSGNSSTQVLVNRGSRDGLSEGMEMIIFRDQMRVGKIRITEAFPTDSEARIVENTLGIRPEDRARAVFPMPEFTRSGELVRPAHRSNSVSALGKTLLVLLAGMVIFAASRGSGTVTGVTAEPDTVNFAPAVRITWRDNLFGGSTLEYHLWRSPGASFNFTGIPVAAIGLGQHQVYDFPAPFTNWNGINSFLQAPNASSSGGTSTSGNSTAAAVTPAAGTGPSGFDIGTTYTYQVTAIIRRTAAGASTTGGATTEDIESGTVSSGPATPITQPQLNFPASGQANINLAALSFNWLSVNGADVFQAEISTDQTFTDKSRIVQLPLVFSTSPNATGVTQNLPSSVDLTNSSLNAPLRRDPVFANFVNRVSGAATPTLFWRIGARNNGDRPGPVNWLTKNSSDSDRSFRFIYSQVRSFQPAALPPAPP